MPGIIRWAPDVGSPSRRGSTRLAALSTVNWREVLDRAASIASREALRGKSPE